MQILALTTLYPSETRPNHGIFVENRLRALAAAGHDVRVVAPVPRFPFKFSLFRAYATMAQTPPSEERHGIHVTHPRYTLIPKIGMTAAVSTLTQCFKNAIRDAANNGFVPDLIDAHYLYPDGVAAVRAAEHFGLETIMTARGSDVTELPNFPRQRAMIMDAAKRSRAIITVSESLRQGLIELGATPDKITTIRNGVDLDTFTPAGADTARKSYDLTGPLLLSVGHLIPRKGHDLVIKLLPKFPDHTLVIAGDGPELSALKATAKAHNVDGRVRFLGAVPHHELSALYNAADVLVLASTREGWPNVLLEAMASGTPCLAAPIGGCAEVITDPVAGRVANTRSVDALSASLTDILKERPTPTAVRGYAEKFSWNDVAVAVDAVWNNALQSTTGKWGATVKRASTARPRLLVTIDTEECFSWNGTYTDWTIPPVDTLQAIQDMARRHDANPVFFVSHPLLNDDEIAARLAVWHKSGEAATGLHMHAWSTPPEPTLSGIELSYQSNIDRDLHRQKLQTLIDLYTQRFSAAPECHRAGRYGVAPFVLDQLAAEGILLDCSPSPGSCFRKQGGPDFLGFSPLLRRRETTNGTQWVLPVSGARMRRRGNFVRVSSDDPIKMPVPDQIRGSAAIRLTPEGTDDKVMRKLARHLVADGVEYMTISIHSSTIVPGATPYASTAAECQAILDRMGSFIDWARDEGIEPVSLAEMMSDLKAR